MEGGLGCVNSIGLEVEDGTMFPPTRQFRTYNINLAAGSRVCPHAYFGKKSVNSSSYGVVTLSKVGPHALVRSIRTHSSDYIRSSTPWPMFAALTYRTLELPLTEADDAVMQVWRSPAYTRN